MQEALKGAVPDSNFELPQNYQKFLELCDKIYLNVLDLLWHPVLLYNLIVGLYMDVLNGRQANVVYTARVLNMLTRD